MALCNHFCVVCWSYSAVNDSRCKLLLVSVCGINECVSYHPNGARLTPMERWPYFRYFRPILCTVENDSGLNKVDLTSEVTLNRGHTLLDFNIFHSRLFSFFRHVLDRCSENEYEDAFV